LIAGGTVKRIFRILPILLLCCLPNAAGSGSLLDAAQKARHEKLCNSLVAPCCWREPVSIHRSPESLEVRGQAAELIAAGKSDREILDEFISRGDLHMHSTWTDGNSTIEEMVRACQEHGYQYCAITDHSQENRVAGGLGAKDFKKQRKEIEKARKQFPKVQVPAGVELDILADGSLDLPDKALGGFDIVIAAIYSNLNMTKSAASEPAHRSRPLPPS